MKIEGPSGMNRGMVFGLNVRPLTDRTFRGDNRSEMIYALSDLVIGRF